MAHVPPMLVPIAWSVAGGKGPDPACEPSSLRNRSALPPTAQWRSGLAITPEKRSGMPAGRRCRLPLLPPAADLNDRARRRPEFFDSAVRAIEAASDSQTHIPGVEIDSRVGCIHSADSEDG